MTPHHNGDHPARHSADSACRLAAAPAHDRTKRARSSAARGRTDPSARAMLRLVKRSVRYRLIAVIMATTVAALVVASAALLSYEVNHYRRFVVADATTQADIVALTTAPMLVFDDPEAAAENLAPLATRGNIRAAAIYTADGKLFAATASAEGVDYPPLPTPLASRFAGGMLELFHPIVYNDEVIGAVFLQATYDLAGRVKSYLLILAPVMLLSLIVAGVISLRLE